MNNKIINLLNISIKNNKKGFIIKNNNKNNAIIKALIDIKIIKFVKKDNINKNIILYINYYKNKPIFKNITNLYKKSNKIYINYKNIEKLNNKYNWVLLISTSSGILNNFEAAKKKIGGILILKIYN